MAWTNPRTWTDGELENASILNQHIRDNLLALGPHLIVRKPSDESVTSSVTFQADDHLILPVGASDVWQFEFNLLVTADPAADIAIRFTFPASGTLAGHLFGGVDNSILWAQLGATTSPSSVGTVNVTSSTAPDLITARGVYVGGGTAGNVGVEWAQAVSSATATKVLTNSTLWAVKLA